MKRVELAQATAPLAEYARRAHEEGVVVTVRGRPVAAVTAVPEGADWESLAISTHPVFLEIMERSRRAHSEQGGISPDEMRRRLGIKPKPRGRTRRRTTPNQSRR
jgi:prevent-host-death family protein